MHSTQRLLGAFLGLLALAAGPLHAQTTAFTYQGRLTDSGLPATGIYDLRFTIYDAVSSGNAAGTPLTNATVAVTNGLFTLTLDFGGGVFTGADRWLEIGVRTNGSAGAHALLAPRQSVTAAPYAVQALSAQTAYFASSTTNVAAVHISGIIPDARLSANVPLLNASNYFSGSASFGGLLSAPTVLASNFNSLSGPLEFKVNGVRALRLEPGVAYPGAVNLIGGGADNAVGSGISGATIGGGGSNNISRFSDFATIGGGVANTIQSNATASTISGGTNNTVQVGSIRSVIAGGSFNTIGTNANRSSVGGGSFNTVNSQKATISGGYDNKIDGNSFSSSSSTIAGGEENTIANASVSSIAGGSYNLITNGSGSIGGGASNIISGAGAATIGGGVGNANQAGFSTIGGGWLNQIFRQDGINSRVGNATISGGFSNIIGSNAYSAAIGGGWRNTIQHKAEHSSIAGGEENTVGESAWWATIGGGYVNTIGDYHRLPGFTIRTDGCTIAGGGGNWIVNLLIPSNSINYATIGGGSGNTNTGHYATVPGGYRNTAGTNAFAAGTRAQARHTGSFVWADSTDADFASTGMNQFLIRASGGVGIGSTAPQAPLHVGTLAANGNAMTIGVDATAGGFTALNFGLSARSNGYAFLQAIESSGSTYGNLVLNRDGGKVGIGTNSPQSALHVVGNIEASGTITPASDRNVKKNFEPVDARSVLESVVALPIQRWTYKAEADAIRHVGPMAQDFKAAFGLGANDKTIATVDADGVALAAIQGLNQKLDERSQDSGVRIQKLEAENAELKQRLEALEVLVKSINK